MKLTVKCSTSALRGSITVPGDKSISHRALLLGSYAHGVTEVRGFLPSADCLRTLRIIRELGVEVTGRTHDVLCVHGRGPDALREPRDVLNAGNSGTTARLLFGLLAGQPFFAAVTGDDSLKTRPMRRVVEPLSAMGARFLGRSNNERLPLGITGRYPLKPINYHLPVPSAQLKSALLIAGLRAEGETTVGEDLTSRNHTEEMLAAFGADVKVTGTSVTVRPSRLTAVPVSVPGDISSAAFFLVAASIVPGSDVLIKRVGVNVTRTGILDVLREMGASISIVDQGVSGGEPWADLRVTAAQLRGVRVPAHQAPRLIDEVPVLAVAACAAVGETVFEGVGELRVKESDRLQVMADEFGKLGARIMAGPDYLRVQGGTSLSGAPVRSHGDHRIAMSLAVCGLVARGETSIAGAECIETSFPGFAPTLASLSPDDLLNL